MSDQELRKHVIDELEFEPSIDAAHIGVAADSGIVTLTGYVKTFAERAVAERAAKRVKGVKGIAQEIEVRLPGDKKVSDDEIAKRAVNIIAWDTTIPADRVMVKVQDGWVTLSGKVEWQYQKTSASEAVHRLSGVRGVSNIIDVEPRLTSAGVKKRIEEALKRNAEIEASGIRVDVVDSKVTLDGKVRAWFEREVIERAAWSAPGVKSVEDHVRVR